jgi:hypothetical protein
VSGVSSQVHCRGWIVQDYFASSCLYGFAEDYPGGAENYDEREGEQQRRRTNDAPAPEAGDQSPDKRHGGKSSDRSPEQGEAEQTFTKAESLLHGGYPDDPGPDNETVGEKHPEHREPGHPQHRPVM